MDIAEQNLDSLKDAVWSLTGIIPQILQATEWWYSEVETMNHGHRIEDMKNYYHEFKNKTLATQAEFDQWVHLFTKNIINGRIKAGGFTGVEERWVQNPLIEILENWINSEARGIAVRDKKGKPYTTVSTITEKRGYGSTRMFQKDAVFRIESKMKNKDYDMPFRLRSDFDKERGRPSDWEYKKITYGFPEVFEDNPYIFYGETDTGGYLWNVKVEFDIMPNFVDLDAEGIAAMKDVGLNTEHPIKCFMIFQFTDSDFWRPWVMEETGSFNFGLEQVIMGVAGTAVEGGRTTFEQEALNQVYENIMYSEYGDDKSEDPEDIYRTAILSAPFRERMPVKEYEMKTWLEVWLKDFPRFDEPLFGLLNWWW